jgi:hypothetical protein
MLLIFYVSNPFLEKGDVVRQENQIGKLIPGILSPHKTLKISNSGQYLL